MASKPTPRVSWLARYERALRAYLAGRNAERWLQEAYELGRQGMAEGKGVVETIALHHQSLLKLLDRDVAALNDLTLRRSGEFLSEAMSAFEMTHQAFDATRDAMRGVHDFIERDARRVAVALHDGAGQLLAATHLQLNNLARNLPAKPRAQIRQTRRLLNQVEVELRGLAHEIHPPALDDLGLIAALLSLSERFTARTGIRIVTDLMEERRLPTAVETAIYRVAQEALNNVRKHAKAKSVRMTVSDLGRTIVCRVSDDGIGFDQRAATNRGGLGLISMRERVKSLGGNVDLRTSPGRGTECRVQLPVGA